MSDEIWIEIIRKSKRISGLLYFFTPQEDGDDSIFTEFTKSDYCKEHNGYYFSLNHKAII